MKGESKGGNVKTHEQELKARHTRASLLNGGKESKHGRIKSVVLES